VNAVVLFVLGVTAWCMKQYLAKSFLIRIICHPIVNNRAHAAAYLPRVAETQLRQLVLGVAGVPPVGLPVVEPLRGRQGGFHLGGVARHLVLAVHRANVRGGLLLDRHRLPR